jgi:excisionase family DNA binding protein
MGEVYSEVAMVTEKKLYSLKEYAELTGRAQSTAFRDLRLGRIPFVQLGGRRYIPAAALDALIASALPAQPLPVASAEPCPEGAN